MISGNRSAVMAALLVAAALVPGSASAQVVFNVSGTFNDGGTLSGTFTTDNGLTALLSTSLTVSGGSLGLNGVTFNDNSYIAAGTVNLPNSFYLYAPSTVDKSLSLFFASPLTLSGATLTGASTNYQQFVGSRTLVSGSVVGTAVGAVPEPASWALVIGGFGLLGAGLRRARTKVRFAA